MWETYQYMVLTYYWQNISTYIFFFEIYNYFPNYEYDYHVVWRIWRCLDCIRINEDIVISCLWLLTVVFSLTLESSKLKRNIPLRIFFRSVQCASWKLRSQNLWGKDSWKFHMKKHKMGKFNISPQHNVFQWKKIWRSIKRLDIISLCIQN